MSRAFKEHVTVQPGGLIEIRRPDLPTGTTAEVIIVLPDEAGNGHPPPPPGPPLASYFGSCRDMFKSADEVDAYIRSLRDEWDRP
jgi:hypothetical protein